MTRFESVEFNDEQVLQLEWSWKKKKSVSSFLNFSSFYFKDFEGLTKTLLELLLTFYILFEWSKKPKRCNRSQAAAILLSIFLVRGEN